MERQFFDLYLPIKCERKSRHGVLKALLMALHKVGTRKDTFPMLDESGKLLGELIRSFVVYLVPTGSTEEQKEKVRLTKERARSLARVYSDADYSKLCLLIVASYKRRKDDRFVGLKRDTFEVTIAMEGDYIKVYITHASGVVRTSSREVLEMVQREFVRAAKQRYRRILDFTLEDVKVGHVPEVF